jgi:hypothetical protein
MRVVAAAGAGFIAVVALVAALLAVAPFEAAAQEDGARGGSESAAASEPAMRPASRLGRAVTQVLEELVEEQIITAGQAETITERLRERSEEPGAKSQQRRRARRAAARLFADARALIIEITGLSRVEFTEAWRDGNSLGAIVAEAGVTQTELTQALVVTAEEKIDALLDDHQITVEQAKRLGDGVEERAAAIVDRMWNRTKDDVRRPRAGDA